MSGPRVLLIAEQANPTFVSVPLEGWSLSRAIAARVDAHVVTQVRNRQAFLDAGLTESDAAWGGGRGENRAAKGDKSGATTGGDFTAIDSERVAAKMHVLAGALRGGKGKGWTTVMAFNAISYAYFERLVWKRFGGAITAGAFDVVHRLTPISPTLPSRLAGWCAKAGVPFVWGPINGGVAWPREFDSARRAEREWLSYIRGAHRWMPGYHATRRHAAAIMVGSAATWQQMPGRYGAKCFYVAENAVDPARFGLGGGGNAHSTKDGDRAADGPAGKAGGGPLRVAFVGRLVPYKGADMLLEAAAPLIREGRLTVTLIGDGPERPRLERLIADEDLDPGVDLAGWVPHEQLRHRLAEHDVFGFPSVREFGGAVVLEAMAVGLVPVVVGYGGPAELVDDATGFRVPIGDRASIVAGVRETLTHLADHPDALAPMAQAARHRVAERFTWDAKAADVESVYRFVTGAGPRPTLEPPPA